MSNNNNDNLIIEKLFKPKSIAVVGASRNLEKIGGVILSNLVKNKFNGKIYAVNPSTKEILGVPSYPSLLDIPDEVEHIVVAIPAEKVPEIIEEAGKKGVKVATIIASGFKEVGRADLEEKVVNIAKKYGIRILGPNVFGVVYTPMNLNATFGAEHIHKGKIAFLTQSGALGIALMHWTSMEKIGLSSIVSMGNMADIDAIDLAKFFEKDENTKVIGLYLEGLGTGKGHEFIEVFSEITKKKPVIALKAGRSERGTRAVASHTGSLAGSDAVYDSALKQAGVLRASDVEQLFNWAKMMAFSESFEINGKGFVIITNGGGMGVMATDASEFNGLPLLEVPEELKKEFRKTMPWFGSPNNPVDLTGQSNVQNYIEAIKVALESELVSGITVMYGEVAFLDPVELANGIAKTLKEYNKSRKPVNVVMLGGEKTKMGTEILEENGVPVYPIPEKAISSMAALYKYSKIIGKANLKI
ncbi:CoA-binding protein [Fervidicoccus fontis]|uniref:CoA-binding protein n=1 Tax=Fervidicoccus fontis TaxID=683846 RepID=A0A843AIK7_9CREN|nr:CoA-binding protein [Fervidicoccus fontis]MBE9391300.1 CoA-binding protein [Fervidicoccus fontis]